MRLTFSQHEGGDNGIMQRKLKTHKKVPCQATKTQMCVTNYWYKMRSPTFLIRYQLKLIFHTTFNPSVRIPEQLTGDILSNLEKRLVDSFCKLT
jgi:hypothetical protein